MKDKSVPKQKRDGFIARFIIRVISRGIASGLREDRNNQIRWRKKQHEKRKAEAAKINEATEKENEQ